jgi:hypothetical protein
LHWNCGGLGDHRRARHRDDQLESGAQIFGWIVELRLAMPARALV